jgi:gamma-glutamylcysteine synthetase
MDEISKDGGYHLVQHPKYRHYMQWKSDKALDERVKRAWEMEMTSNTRMEESRKKKFLFW